MNIIGRKISSKYVVALIFTALFFSVTFNSPANYSSSARFGNFLAFAADTTRPHPSPSKDSIPQKRTLKPGGRIDSLHALTDTLGTDTLGVDSTILSTDSLEALRHRNDTLGVKVSKDTMDAEIDYKADDSVVMDVPGKKVT